MTAPWANQVINNVGLWTIQTVAGKGSGIVATRDIGRHGPIAIYGSIDNKDNQEKQLISEQKTTKNTLQHAERHADNEDNQTIASEKRGKCTWGMENGITSYIGNKYGDYCCYAYMRKQLPCKKDG